MFPQSALLGFFRGVSGWGLVVIRRHLAFSMLCYVFRGFCFVGACRCVSLLLVKVVVMMVVVVVEYDGKVNRTSMLIQLIHSINLT